jgi:hypothetical protein
MEHLNSEQKKCFANTFIRVLTEKTSVVGVFEIETNPVPRILRLIEKEPTYSQACTKLTLQAIKTVTLIKGECESFVFISTANLAARIDGGHRPIFRPALGSRWILIMRNLPEGDSMSVSNVTQAFPFLNQKNYFAAEELLSFQPFTALCLNWPAINDKPSLITVGALSIQTTPFERPSGLLMTTEAFVGDLLVIKNVIDELTKMEGKPSATTVEVLSKLRSPEGQLIAAEILSRAKAAEKTATKSK